MKLTRWTIILLGMFISIHLRGQDTISVYFEFGHYKIPAGQFENLNNIPANYNLSEADSVLFIGMADSVGDFKENIKLSEKRAKNVAKYCEQLFPENISTKITALGETTIHEIDKNRRVDIILYFQHAQNEEVQKVEFTPAKKICYNIDYQLLHRCHIRTVKKGKKEMVVIETTLPDLKKKKEHYYGSTTNDGNFVVKRLKWISKNTGNLWWSHSRYVATIPKKDFDTYKIFKIKEPPCDSCNEDFQTKAEITNEDTCIQVDRFLMENLQFRTRLFNNRWVQIRAPREYVNIDAWYFIGCIFQDQLVWETKKGRRKQHYYYSALPRDFNDIANITKVMNCCENDPEPSECDHPIICCQTLFPPDRSFILNAEIGAYYQKSRIIPYAGIGISKEGEVSRGAFLVGTDIDLSFCSSLEYQCHFLSFPFNALNPFSSWQSPTTQKFINRYGRLYIGTELKTRINKNKQNFLEQNIHIGLVVVNTNTDAFIPRIFVQYGLGINYLETSPMKVYSIVQLGLNIKIARLNKR